MARSRAASASRSFVVTEPQPRKAQPVARDLDDAPAGAAEPGIDAEDANRTRDHAPGDSILITGWPQCCSGGRRIADGLIRKSGKNRRGTCQARPGRRQATQPRNAMTPGLGFALGAMLCFGAGDLIYKRARRSRHQVRRIPDAAGLDLCSRRHALCLADRDARSAAAALWGALAGLFLFVALYNFAQSLQGGAVSTNAPIFRLNFTITAALAILLLGETLTLAKALALAGALIAVWLLLAEPGAKPGKSSLASLGRGVVCRDLGHGLHQFLLQSRPAARRAAGDDGCRAGLGVLFAGDTVRLLARRAPSHSARRLGLCRPRRTGAVRRLRAAAARAGTRAGQRTGAGGADELRHHRAVWRRDVPRAAGFAKMRRACRSPPRR